MMQNQRHDADPAALMKALREAVEDLNRAQAVANTGSWRLDIRRNELRWSDQAYRIFGVEKGTPMTYESFLSVVHPDDREYVDKSWQAALRGEPYDIEHRIRVGDNVMWVRERAELEFDAGGALKGGFGTTQDITGLKLLEQQKADFYALVTHDLKSPLTTILGYADFMLSSNKGLDADVREMLGSIHGAGARLLRMVDDFLALSKMESGKPVLRLAEADLFLTLWETRNDIETVLKEKGLTLEMFPADDLPKVFVDQKLVQRAVTNLLHNAIAYTPAGGKVTLRAGRQGGFVVISVSDTGPGIPHEEQARVFDRYYRSPSTAYAKGASLGLALVKAVAEQHGGRVELESEPGKGSTFRLFLPVGLPKGLKAPLTA